MKRKTGIRAKGEPPRVDATFAKYTAAEDEFLITLEKYRVREGKRHLLAMDYYWVLTKELGYKKPKVKK